MISAAFPYQKQRRSVLGREMAYVEGAPSGAPTSSATCASAAFRN
jgi:hypothetical protein